MQPIPVHLQELSPPELRSLMVGFTYQLGNLASSASATIQSTIGERYPLPPLKGVKRFDYGRVIAIFMGAVWAYQLFWLFLGPEMTEQERQATAEEAALLEQMRLNGASLQEIGASRVTSRIKTRDTDMSRVDSEAAGKVEDIERVQQVEKV